MLKTWDYGAPYIEVGQSFRLGFALVDVYDEMSLPYDPYEYSEWVGFTVFIESGDGLTCPDYSIYDGDSFNVEGGGGNSGEVSPANTFSDFQDHVQDGQCYNALYAIAQNVIAMDFVTTGPAPSDDDEVVTNYGLYEVVPYDYVSFAVTYDDDYLSIGWMCEAAINCPIEEVARYDADDGQVLIVLQVS